MSRTRTSARDGWLSEYLGIEAATVAERAVARTGPATMRCPRCGDLLVQIVVGKVQAECCSSCTGMFFDSADLQFLLRAHGAPQLIEVFAALLRVAQPPDRLRPRHLEL